MKNITATLFLLFSGVLTGCSTTHHQLASDSPQPASETTTTSTTQTPAPATATADKSAESVAPPAPPTKPAILSEKPSVSPETALLWLQHGNDRFVKKALRSDGKSAADRTRLVSSQHPHTIVLACSDSRVPPEIVFDQALGEIYVIRVAGEALDSAVIGSIEYAVQHLHPGLLLVLGHSRCETVKAALALQDSQTTGSPDLDKMIADIRPRLATVKNDAVTEKLEVESILNADGVARDLVKRSEIIKQAVDAGNLKIKSALYRMDTGRVTFY